MDNFLHNNIFDYGHSRWRLEKKESIKKMKVTLLIPTLNEIDGMRAIMPLIKKEWCDQIIILDGKSTDGTIEYAKKQGYFVYVQKKPESDRDIWKCCRTSKEISS